jgi:hypothetical protein
MNYIFIIVLIILAIMISCQKSKENFLSSSKIHEPDLLYTYEYIFHPEYIKPHYKNYNFLELSQTPFRTGTKECKDCSSLDKDKCGLCFECGWCIDGSGKGKCVSGGMYGHHSFKDKKNCQIYRHPSLFRRFSGPFTGRKFLKDGEYDNYWKPHSL